MEITYTCDGDHPVLAACYRCDRSTIVPWHLSGPSASASCNNLPQDAPDHR